MDRIDAMKVFVTAVDEGSLAGAARPLKRSPTAVSRALSFLEARLGVELLHRTTRTLKLSEAGERYAAACRRVLTDLNEADMLASGERSSPCGVLTISAPPVNGEEMLRPIIDEFLDLYPDVSAKILLLDRLVNLADEGVDIALRIGHLRDSSLVTTRLGGDVRRVVVGSPRYLAKHPPSKNRQIWLSTTSSRSAILVSMLGVSSRRKARPFPEPFSSYRGAPSTVCAPPRRRPYPVAV
jgi:DNA-binding transcriptional LysR family regulator